MAAARQRPLLQAAIEEKEVLHSVVDLILPSPTIIYLVLPFEASKKQRRQFLSFVTSLPHCDPGKIEVTDGVP
jgi:hypothetical protein